MKVINLGTYLPKQCGIATFSNDLRHSLLVNNVEVDVIAISDDSYSYEYGKEVKFNIEQNIKNDYINAANFVNSQSDIDAVIIQHEYGIFGGSNGNYIIDFASRLEKPFLVITHTVLAQPFGEQRNVLHKLCKYASKVIAMTERATILLNEVYKVDKNKIKIIGHGVPHFLPQPSLELKKKYNLLGRQVISTFGLIGPGKGLELGIKAMVDVVKAHPDALFLILGQTHPMLKKFEGEKYREMLIKLINELNLNDHIKFVNKFLTDAEVGEYLYLTDVYLSPYPNMEQAVSGTLTFAIGCGRAIVSTAYAYATEMLKNNRGLLATKADPKILARLINSVLADKNLKTTLQNNAYHLGKNWSWPNIGKKYSHIINGMVNDIEEEDLLKYARL